MLSVRDPRPGVTSDGRTIVDRFQHTGVGTRSQAAGESCAHLKTGRADPFSTHPNRQPVERVGYDLVRPTLDVQARPGSIQRMLEVADTTGRFTEPSGMTGRRSVRIVSVERGGTDRQRHPDERRGVNRCHGNRARPMVLVSVPNHTSRVGAW